MLGKIIVFQINALSQIVMFRIPWYGKIIDQYQILRFSNYPSKFLESLDRIETNTKSRNFFYI